MNTPSLLKDRWLRRWFRPPIGRSYSSWLAAETAEGKLEAAVFGGYTEQAMSVLGNRYLRSWEVGGRCRWQRPLHLSTSVLSQDQPSAPVLVANYLEHACVAVDPTSGEVMWNQGRAEQVWRLKYPRWVRSADALYLPYESGHWCKVLLATGELLEEGSFSDQASARALHGEWIDVRKGCERSFETRSPRGVVWTSAGSGEERRHLVTAALEVREGWKTQSAELVFQKVETALERRIPLDPFGKFSADLSAKWVSGHLVATVRYDGERRWLRLLLSPDSLHVIAILDEETGLCHVFDSAGEVTQHLRV